MRTIIFSLTLIFLFVAHTSYGQSNNQVKYSELVEQAQILYNSENYKESAELYKEAFSANDNKAYPTDRYNAARSFALANDKESAFYHLFRLANASQFSDYVGITKEKDFIPLHSDERWEKLLLTVKANKEEEDKYLNLELIAFLDTVYQTDQENRGQVMTIMNEFGEKSPQMDSLWVLIDEGDSLNQAKVKKLLDEKGWLGAKTVGKRGALAMFLVIQHSDLATQLEYLPVLREAVAKGIASASHLAYLEDRVAIRQGEKQIYGTQTGFDPETGKSFVSPLLDPENVDKRRSELGLGPLEAYLKNFNIDWNVEEYIKNLLEIEKKQWKQ